MIRCPEECGKQWRPVQGKSGWEKQKEEEAKEEAGKKWEKKEKRKRQKKEKMVEVKRVAKEWEIWDKEEKAAKSEAEAKKIVPEKFHPWIKVLGKKQSERMLTRKVWDYTIEIKEGFVPRKEKVYLLLKEEREEVREFIQEHLEIYPAIKVTTNSTGILCRKKGWKEEDGARLQVFELVNNKEQLSSPTNIRHLGEHQNEESVYKDRFEVGVQQCENQGRR